MRVVRTRTPDAPRSTTAFPESNAQGAERSIDFDDGPALGQPAARHTATDVRGRVTALGRLPGGGEQEVTGLVHQHHTPSRDYGCSALDRLRCSLG